MLLSETGIKAAFNKVFPTWSSKWWEFGKGNTISAAYTKGSLWLEVSPSIDYHYPLIELKSLGTYTNE